MSQINSEPKSAQTSRWIGIMSAVIGGIILFYAAASWLAGTAAFHRLQALSESVNRDYAGKTYQVPAEGVDFQLEARVVGTDFWYHDILTVNFGDQIEFRLRVASIDPNIVAQFHYEKYQTAGLKSTNLEHQQFMDVDGSMVDYFSPDRNSIAYKALGIYQLTRKDWLYGEPASTFGITITGEINGDPVDEFTERLYVVAPDNFIDLHETIILVIVGLIMILCVPQLTMRNSLYWRQVVKEWKEEAKKEG